MAPNASQTLHRCFQDASQMLPRCRPDPSHTIPRCFYDAAEMPPDGIPQPGFHNSDNIDSTSTIPRLGFHSKDSITNAVWGLALGSFEFSLAHSPEDQVQRPRIRTEVQGQEASSPRATRPGFCRQGDAARANFLAHVLSWKTRHVPSWMARHLLSWKL